jgi:hypothetical protein
VSQVKLIIQPEGKFTLEDAGMPKSGTFESQPKGGLLHVDTIMGRGIESEPEDVRRRNVPIQLKLQPDGSLTYFDPAGFDPQPLELEKQADKDAPALTKP